MVSEWEDIASGTVRGLRISYNSSKQLAWATRARNHPMKIIQRPQLARGWPEAQRRRVQ